MSAEAEPEAIAVIDDDYAMRLSCRKILAKAGYRVEVFENGAQGLEGVARLKPDLVVVDLKMPGISGMEVIARVHELDANITVVVITGYATIDTAVEAMKCGAYDFLPKPFSPDELRIIVKRGLERRRLAIETQRCELERAVMRRRFVTFVSHQLQTPLAAIHQYLDVLKSLGDTPEAAAKREEWFDRCLKRTADMQALIKDWLTLARVEGHKLAAQRTRVDLNGIIANILATCEPLASENGITLESRLPGGSCPASGEAGCLTALFDNLIVNAIKYNKPGGRVTVSASRGPDEVIVSVADTGIGIPPEHRRMLFDEFFRVEGAGAKKTSGTGLGLAICRRIVTELGGAIEVESEAGQGSTFTVRLLAWREAPAGVADAV
ncbi:MAG: response regulator [Acidobacteriota bacterium]